MPTTENADIATTDESPLSPEVEQVRRKLMRLMLVTLSITFLFLAAVLIAVIYKITRNPSSADTSTSTPLSSPFTPIEQHLALPPATRILSYSIADPIIALETSDPQDNHTFILYDYRNSRLVTRLRISASATPIQNRKE